MVQYRNISKSRVLVVQKDKALAKAYSTKRGKVRRAATRWNKIVRAGF